MKLEGYKTYVTIAVLVIKQLLAAMGIQIADQDLNTVLDVLLLIAAGVFKYVGSKRDKVEVPPGYVKEEVVK